VSVSVSAQAHAIRLVIAPALADQIRGFLIDREARFLSKRTLAWYGEQLAPFRSFVASQGIDSLDSLTPTAIRLYLLAVGAEHNPGGVAGRFRAVRALCNWYAVETDGWKNQASKVTAPRVPSVPLEPVDLDNLRAMLDTCEHKTFCGDRDRALLMFLLDSGCRRAEFCALDLGDLDMATGAVLVRHGKGDKQRTAFVGAETRRAMVAYLKHRHGLEGCAPLWVSERGERLSFTALRAILERRARLAGVPAPSPHDFRAGSLSIASGLVWTW
jgi:site-specific recombinase XerD